MGFWQGDARWGGIMLGHGPAKIGAAGCVLTSLVEAANRLAGRTLNPATANMLLMNVPGAFVGDDGVKPGDELVVPVAAPHLGLEAGALVQGDDLVPALRAALAEESSGALVRVEVTGGVRPEHHTVFCFLPAGPFFQCTDSAWPKQDGVAGGFCVLDEKARATLRWNGALRNYRAIAVRQVKRAAN